MLSRDHAHHVAALYSRRNGCPCLLRMVVPLAVLLHRLHEFICDAHGLLRSEKDAAVGGAVEAGIIAASISAQAFFSSSTLHLELFDADDRR